MASNGRNYMVRATAHDGLVRAFAIDATGVVGELTRRHQTEPAVSAALGRLTTGALLFGAMLKEEDQLVTIRMQGDGPAGTLLATANGKGEVRGLVSNPRPGIDQVRNGKLNVSGAVGTDGQLTVTRDLGMRQPYSGTVKIVSGEIGEDLAHYLATSEQVPSAVGIGVFVRPDESVEAAGGYIVQLMPGVADRTAGEIEEAVRALPHPTTMLRQQESPEDILVRIFGGDGFTLLDRTPVRFHCPCSRERAERALLLLGAERIEELRADAEPATELTCEFCLAAYEFSDAELAALVAMSTDRG
jgi:molecular chaperone Hsp33